MLNILFSFEFNLALALALGVPVHLYVHFHLLPVTHQSWSEIFDFTLNAMSQEDLDKEIALFRTYFSQS